MAGAVLRDGGSPNGMRLADQQVNHQGGRDMVMLERCLSVGVLYLEQGGEDEGERVARGQRRCAKGGWHRVSCPQ